MQRQRVLGALSWLSLSLGEALPRVTLQPEHQNDPPPLLAAKFPKSVLDLHLYLEEV